MDKVAEAYVKAISSINYDEIARKLLEIMPENDRAIVAVGMAPEFWLAKAARVFEQNIKARNLTGVTAQEFKLALSNSLIKMMYTR